MASHLAKLLIVALPLMWTLAERGPAAAQNPEFKPRPGVLLLRGGRVLQGDIYPI